MKLNLYISDMIPDDQIILSPKKYSEFMSFSEKHLTEDCVRLFNVKTNVSDFQPSEKPQEKTCQTCVHMKRLTYDMKCMLLSDIVNEDFYCARYEVKK